MTLNLIFLTIIFLNLYHHVSHHISLLHYLQGPFLLALTAELATEGKAQNNRQLAGLYIKNLITGKVTSVLQFFTIIKKKKMEILSRHRRLDF